MPPAGGQPEPVPPPKKAEAASPAQVIVELPAEAKLYVDDVPMKTTSTKRVFKTPALEQGVAYYYIVRAEVTREGETVSKSQQLIVRAGETVRAAFPDLEAVATNR